MSARPDMLRDWNPAPGEVIEFDHDLCDYLEALCRDCTDGPMELEFDGIDYHVIGGHHPADPSAAPCLACFNIVDMQANARLFTLAKPVILSMLRVIRHQLKQTRHEMDADYFEESPRYGMNRTRLEDI